MIIHIINTNVPHPQYLVYCIVLCGFLSKFAICFENCPFPGYISEKIFDCLLAGCIPIYYGAPDISSHIPYNCYIDFRDFMSFSELNKYLDSIDESLANKYLDQALMFLNSNEFKKFDEDFFVKKLIEIFKIELNK